ncbi:MAG: manganese efflux pump MntP family protein [Pelolinea sp.]|nr:manganese efflux pump MntP family protein [Pelolinea sp.]
MKKMNEFLILLLIAVGLAVDCFTVSLCIGSSPRPLTFRSVFRVSFHFGLFQGGMAFLGWLLGTSLVQLLANVDHWIALLLLAWVGGRMILEGVSAQRELPEESCEDRTRGSSLVMLSIATSIDSLGVGLSLAFMDANITSASLLIGIISLILSIAGLFGGRRIGQRFGKRAGVIGGLVLIIIGLRIVIAHTIA